MGENVKESIDFQEDDLTIEELMELDQDALKSDEASIQTCDKQCKWYHGLIS